jgi:hypothetical protein
VICQATRFILGVRNLEASLRRADAPWMIAIVAFGGIRLVLGLARASAASGSLFLDLEGLAANAGAEGEDFRSVKSGTGPRIPQWPSHPRLPVQ